jgi:GrpB-like predicted nucleotidyltransferase (UPF0157 family)
MLGLKHGVKRLVDYDPQWPLAFEANGRAYIEPVGTAALGIEHFTGQTGLFKALDSN